MNQNKCYLCKYQFSNWILYNLWLPYRGKHSALHMHYSGIPLDPAKYTDKNNIHFNQQKPPYYIIWAIHKIQLFNYYSPISPKASEWILSILSINFIKFFFGNDSQFHCLCTHNRSKIPTPFGLSGVQCNSIPPSFRWPWPWRSMPSIYRW